MNYFDHIETKLHLTHRFEYTNIRGWQITRYDPLHFHTASNACCYTVTVACLSISIIRSTHLVSIDL